MIDDTNDYRSMRWKWDLRSAWATAVYSLSSLELRSAPISNNNIATSMCLNQQHKSHEIKIM